MAKLQKHWARGLKAGDLVWHDDLRGERMAEVLTVPAVAAVVELFQGQVPIAYLTDLEKRGVWIPADDLELITTTQ